MLDKLFYSPKNQYLPLNIVIIESVKFRSSFFSKLLTYKRPHHNLIVTKNIEEVFTLLYQEVKIDLIVFDIDLGLNVKDLSIVEVVSPSTSFLHWSSCQHPEIIELLHGFGVNSFCLKDSHSDNLIAAIDSINTNPRILYLDERLGKCLPLLTS